MRDRDHSPTPKGLRGWWLSPPRSGLQRLLAPFEYRRLRLFGVIRLVGGGVAAAVGIVCLGYDAYGWGTFFLAIGALDLAAGGWELRIARSQSTGT